ncbi:restriction endonuclease [Virgibacillus litoralis]|uniref:Mrr-cat superfamily restriction endonuclease n=1 Tax=Virgibacillus litoralis TaxID=578221 RepID=A0ABS4HGK0_9BACI|nr:hypothetical protein [Virgibacillus litoralis]MBP1950055.1 putative Mrr-cat superfamily restriction endonuclease [Virgibacillus litoralis]
MEDRVWLVRPLPHGSNHMKDFLSENIIAVGYPVGEELTNCNDNQIRSLLKEHGWEVGIGNVNTLVHAMNVGDIVVVPDDNKKDVYFGKITSDYQYEKELDENKPGSGYPHQRQVEWYFDKKPLLRSELPDELRGSMRYPGTIADITKHHEHVFKTIKDPSLNSESTLEHKAKKVLEEMLKHENPEVKLRAAEIILK